MFKVFVWFVVFFLYSTTAFAVSFGQDVVDVAKTYIGKEEGECKVFINKVFSRLGIFVGGATGLGYRDAYLRYGFIEVDDPQPGDVIQTSNPGLSHLWDSYDRPYHTAIFEKIAVEGTTQYHVIDSNRVPAFEHTVAYGVWDPYQYVANKPGHQVYFYRYVGEITLDAVAKFPDGSTHHQILNRYNQAGGKDVVGWPHDDGAGIFVHPWTPWRLELQNFRNAKGEQSIIMYGSLWQHQAFRVFGEVWEAYRYGYGGHFGPGIVLPNGKYLGGPTSEYINGVQYFENGYYVKRVGAFFQNNPKSSAFKTDTAEIGAVLELRQTDGTLVESYNPTGEMAQLTLSARPVSNRQVIAAWFGGPVADYYQVFRNGVHHNTVALPEFTETGLTPGATYTYQIVAVSSVQGELQQSNEVSVAMPGAIGTFTLQGLAEGSPYAYIQWHDSLYNTQFHWVYRDGVLIAKSASDAFSDFPLAPLTTYRYEVAAVTFSGLVFGWSNPVFITTGQAPEPPPLAPSTATTVELEMESVWPLGIGGQATATVYDQYGMPMPEVEVLFLSSDFNILVIDGNNGSYWAQQLGQVEVWSEVKDQRHIKSARLTVSVVDQLDPPPIEPDVFPTSELALEQYIQVLNQKPYVGYFDLCWRLEVTNPTTQPMSITGLTVGVYSLSGQLLRVLPYLPASKTLNPGQIEMVTFCGWLSVGPGQYLLRAHVKLPTDGANDWHWVTGEPLAITIFDTTDLRAEIEVLSFRALVPTGQDSLMTGDQVRMYLMMFNSGHKAIDTPFEVLMTISGNEVNLSQFQTVDAIPVGWTVYRYFDFGPLPAGSYKVDCLVDVSNQIVEYDKGNNVQSLIVEVLPNPTDPTHPALHFTHIPVWGDLSGDGVLRGGSLGLDPSTTELVAFIKVSGVWYHAQYPSLRSAIQSDGSWSIRLCATQPDYYASEFMVYAIPIGSEVPNCWPNQCLSPPDIPAVLTTATGQLATVVPPVAPPNATLHFTVIPAMGDLESLTVLQVSGISPADFHRYRVAVYSLVNVATPPWEYWRWYLKSDPITLSSIRSDGTVVCYLRQHWADDNAIDIMAFLVLAQDAVPLCGDNLECGLAPPVVDPIDSVYAVRPQATLEPLQGSPELSVGITKDPQTVMLDEEVMISRQVTNSGNAKSSPSTITISFDNTDHPVSLPTLVSGESVDQSLTLTASMVGEQLVTVSLDDNITAQQAVTVLPWPVVKLPDLVITNIHLKTGSIFGIKLLACVVTVKNVGDDRAGEFHTSFVCPRLNKTYRRKVNGLAVGQETSVSVLLISAVTGQVSFEVLADCDHQVTESDETNNAAKVTRTF